MNIESALAPLIPYLHDRATTQVATHRRKLEDIDQALSNRGIPISQEQAFILFMDECRKFLQEEINFSWASIQACLSNPYPSLSKDTFSKICVALDSAVPSVDTILEYFDHFKNRSDKTEAEKLAVRIRERVSVERMLQMKVKQLEINKFLEVIQREELIRRHQVPTIYDKILRVVKDRWLSVIVYLIVLILGLLGGLSTWFCGREYPQQCYSSLWKSKDSEAPKVALRPNPTATPSPTPTAIPTLPAFPTSTPAKSPTQKPIAKAARHNK